ncbi:hypothetical protein Q7P36_002767 [Cladosporium allicinum]
MPPSKRSEPGEASERKASKATPQEELPTMQDLPAITADLSRALQELQRLQHSVAQLHARQEMQESQATSTGPLRLLEQLASTTKRAHEQTSSKETQHDDAGRLPMPQSTKRRPESTLEPTTSKRVREHTDSKQPQQAASQAPKHAKPNVSQQGADDTGVVRPEHKSTAHVPQLVESSPEPNGTTVQVPASSPVVSVTKSRTKDASWVSREKAQEDAEAIRDDWESLEDDTFFFLLSRIKCALKDRLVGSKKNASWVRRNPEALEMLSYLKNLLSTMSSGYPRYNFNLDDFSAREWQIWRSLERSVDKQRDRMLEEEGYVFAE